MRILTPVFITPFAGRLLNIHPSLLPNYPGCTRISGRWMPVTTRPAAQFTSLPRELDGGPPVLQARVSIRPGDTADSLARRVVAVEHEIYPLAALWFLQGRLTLNEQGAFLDGQKIPASGIPYRPQNAVRHNAADGSQHQQC